MVIVKGKMMKQLLITTIALLFSHSLMAGPELKGSPAELSSYLLDARKIINISESAELKVEADQAIVTLSIKNEAKSLDAAIDENETLQQKVKSDLVAAGIAADMIKAANFSSTPDYGWLKDKPKSYEISRELKVTIANALQMRAVAKVVDSIEEVFLGTMDFEDSAKDDNELKVVRQALDKIMLKKALYEKTFSVALSLVKVTDHGVRPVYTAPRMQKARNKAEVFSSIMSDAAIESGSQDSGQFAGITYRASASAEFVITGQ